MVRARWARHALVPPCAPRLTPASRHTGIIVGVCLLLLLCIYVMCCRGGYKNKKAMKRRGVRGGRRRIFVAQLDGPPAAWRAQLASRPHRPFSFLYHPPFSPSHARRNQSHPSPTRRLSRWGPSVAVPRPAPPVPALTRPSSRPPIALPSLMRTRPATTASRPLTRPRASP